jgi:hypothetical protein
MPAARERHRRVGFWRRLRSALWRIDVRPLEDPVLRRVLRPRRMLLSAGSGLALGGRLPDTIAHRLLGRESQVAGVPYQADVLLSSANRRSGEPPAGFRELLGAHTSLSSDSSPYVLPHRLLDSQSSSSGPTTVVVIGASRVGAPPHSPQIPLSWAEPRNAQPSTGRMRPVLEHCSGRQSPRRSGWSGRSGPTQFAVCLIG